MSIEYFYGGSDSARGKLNQIVDAANMIGRLRGDEVFITIRRDARGGVSIALNIDQVMSRVPKVRPPEDEDVGTKQYQVHQMVSDDVSGWDFAMAHPITTE